MDISLLRVHSIATESLYLPVIKMAFDGILGTLPATHFRSSATNDGSRVGPELDPDRYV